MKNNWGHANLGILFFLLTLALALFSWIGSIYGLGEVQSLLSAEGIRWVLGHVVENYVQCPALGIMLVVFMGLGIVVRSGLYDVWKRFCRKEKQLSRKERRALTLASVTLFIYVALVCMSMWLPWNLLRGITGSWAHSPFAEGFVYIFSIGIGLMGMVYGYVSDTFRNLSDVVESMASLIAARAFCFVSLFFVVQFFSSLAYTHLAEWMDMDTGTLNVLYGVSCVLVLFK